MVRIGLLIFSLFLSSAAFAQDLKLSFARTPVLDFTNFAYINVLKKNVIFSDDALSDKSVVSISADKLDPPAFRKLADRVLTNQGFTISEKDNVIYIGKGKAESVESAGAGSGSGSINLSRFSSAPSVDALIPESMKNGVKNAPEKVLKNEGSMRLYLCVSMPCELLGVALQTSFDIQVNVIDKFKFSYRADDVEFAKISEFLKSADPRSTEYIIKAAIIEVGSIADESNGFKLLVSSLSNSLGIRIGSDATLNNSLSFKFSNWEAVISAIQTNSNFNIMSSPHIRTKSGFPARFEVGSQVPTLGAIVSTATSTTQSVAYLPTGTILEVEPTHFENFVDLKLMAEVSSAIPTTNGVNSSPTILKRTISTTISSSDETVFVIGGFSDNSKSRSKSGLSFLPVPLSSSESFNTRDLLLLLTVKKV